MIKKENVILSLMALTTFLIPAANAANESPIIPICDPWKYQYSHYEYKLGSTYVVDLYLRNCNGIIEEKREYQLYYRGHYNKIIMNKIIHSLISLPNQKLMASSTFTISNVCRTISNKFKQEINQLFGISQCLKLKGVIINTIFTFADS